MHHLGLSLESETLFRERNNVPIFGMIIPHQFLVGIEEDAILVFGEGNPYWVGRRFKPRPHFHSILGFGFGSLPHQKANIRPQQRSG